MQYGVLPYIGSVTTLCGVYFSSSYAVMGAGGCDFGFCGALGAGVIRLLGIFTLETVVVLGGFLCMTSIFVCVVSLWGASRGVLFCLNIYSNLMMACNLVAQMGENGAVGYRL